MAKDRNFISPLAPMDARGPWKNINSVRSDQNFALNPANSCRPKRS
jgi:hypothetical protein